MLKVQHRGLSEPHVFTIASGPQEGVLRFFIRDLGDWTSRLVRTDLAGAEVVVEGPYGRFEPTHADAQKTVWVAGGVGITPFLSTIETLEPAVHRPTLFYAVRGENSAMAIDVLRSAADRAIIDLVICDSQQGRRFSGELVLERMGADGLAGAHVAVCGPNGLVASVRELGYRQGALRVEHEDFDLRQGFGPDLFVPLDRLARRSPIAAR